MKKPLLFIFLLLSLTGCEEFRYEEKDDGTISGTVSFIWNQVGLATAYAQTPQDYLDELETFSRTNDFFVSYSSDVYQDVVTNALSDAQFYASEIGALISTNLLQYTAADFPNGAVLVMGFDAQKKLKSFLISPVDASGNYSLKDPIYNQISFYRLAFVLNDSGVSKYRMSHIFRDGKKMKSTVTQESSTASIKLNQSIQSDPTQSLSALKSKLVAFRRVSQSNPSSDDRDLINFYLLYSYSEYYNLNEIQRLIIHSAIYYEMIANPLVANAMMSTQAGIQEEITMWRPADRTKVLLNYCIGDAQLEQYLLTPITDNIESLSDAQLIPSAPLGDLRL